MAGRRVERQGIGGGDNHRRSAAVVLREVGSQSGEGGVAELHFKFVESGVRGGGVCLVFDFGYGAGEREFILGDQYLDPVLDSSRTAKGDVIRKTLRAYDYASRGGPGRNQKKAPKRGYAEHALPS